MRTQAAARAGTGVVRARTDDGSELGSAIGALAQHDLAVGLDSRPSPEVAAVLASAQSEAAGVVEKSVKPSVVPGKFGAAVMTMSPTPVVDTSKAQAMKGVHAVLDFSQVFRTKSVRYAWEGVAAVAGYKQFIKDIQPNGHSISGDNFEVQQVDNKFLNVCFGTPCT